MAHANYGKRVVAVILDWLFAFFPPLVLLVIGITMVMADSAFVLGVFLIIVGSSGWIALSIWNKVFHEGRTGQSFGKARMNIALVDSTSGLPIGAGRAFVREFLFSVLCTFTAGVFWIVDYLWPLWDKNGERVIDKMMTTRVVKHGTTL